MGLHSEAGLNRKFMEFAKLIEHLSESFSKGMKNML